MAISDKLTKLKSDLTDSYKELNIDNLGLSRLPSEYQEVEYIESTGTQYIDTGFKPNQDTKIIIIFNAINNGFLFAEDNDWVQQGFGSTMNFFEFSNFSSDYSHEYNIKTKLEFGKQVKVNDINVYTFIPTIFQAEYNLYIFAGNRQNVSREFISLKLYSFKIYENATLVRDYIPCYRKSDNVAGLYDLVNDVFYTNAGTGTFIVGEDVFYKNTNNLPTAIDNVLDTIKGYIPTNTDTEGVCENAIPLNASVVIDGNSEQDTSKMTYKCDGTETGDYYFVYNSINYQFTMPTITSSSVLVFDTSTLKLYLDSTEIATTTASTGTLITLIASPNPDYPQEIEVVKGTLELKQSGKNLFSDYDYSGTKNNLVFSKKDGILTYSSTATTTDYEVTFDFVDGSYYSNYDVKINEKNSVYLKAGTYTYSWYHTGTNCTMKISGGDIGATSSTAKIYTEWGAGTTEGSGKKTFTLEEDMYVTFGAYFYVNASTSGSFSNFQLESGSSSTTYEPYHEPQTYQINLGDNYLAKVGDVKDTLSIDDKGNVKKIGNIGDDVFSGTQDTYWYGNVNGYFIGYYNLKNYKGSWGNKNVISNYFLYDVNIVYNSNGNAIAGTGKNQSNIRFCISESLASTPDELKKWFSTHNTKLYYELATPTEETLQTDTPIHMCEGTNIFTLDTNIDTDFTVTYYIDAQQALLDTGTEV